MNRLLDRLVRETEECEWLEFKRNLSEERKIGETISAVSNAAFLQEQDYGYIVWGVDDIDHSVVGTDFRPRRQKVGNQEFEGWLASQLSPRVHFEIWEPVYQGQRLAVFIVCPAPGTPVRFQGGAWIRVGSSNRPLRDYPEKERLLWLKGSTAPFEKSFAKRDVSGADALALLDYRKYYELAQQQLPSDHETILGRLAREKLLADTGRGRYEITNLGALSMAHRLSDFDAVGRKAIRVVRYAGQDRATPAEQNSFDIGYATGFEELISSVHRLLPGYESVGIALRQSAGYPPLAVRELVANALIHQDLTVTGASPSVEIFPDRVEFTNPGKPLIKTERFIDEPPRSRNETLASLLRRLRICEEMGTGIDKVIREIERNHLPPPDFQETDSSTRAILYARQSWADMDAATRIRGCYQHACLQYVSEARVLTNASLRQRFAVEARNAATVSRIIRDTVNQGLIKPKSPQQGFRGTAGYIPFWG